MPASHGVDVQVDLQRFLEDALDTHFFCTSFTSMDSLIGDLQECFARNFDALQCLSIELWVIVDLPGRRGIRVEFPVEGE